ncbi:MAG: DUF4266 domain-containing protein [Deltaproteobacteria bacterium]|nr:DUF4266 domain-containing protein [Deltaproteobacteria bacterium]
MNRKRRWILSALFVGALLLIAIGCAVVPAYERGNLADAAMALDGDSLADLYEQKMLQTREPTLPPAGSTSAGCGCK